MRAREAVTSVPTIVLVVGALLGLVACGGGSGSKSTTRTTKAHRPHATTTTRAATTTSTSRSSSSTPPATEPATTTTTAPAGTCGNQTATIVAAVQGSDQLAPQAGQYTVQRCRVAPSSPIWAAADIVPNPGTPLGPATVVVERIGALWNVVTVGSAHLGCDAPASVRPELGIDC